MRICIGLLFVLCWVGCEPEPPKDLPILGHRDVGANGDTVYHRIPDFSFVNQDSAVVNNATFEGKAYVVDFFFTHCPTICPTVKQQMLRVHERFLAEDRLVLLSHTIDTKRDTVGKLRDFARKLEVGTPKWHFVTGDKDAIYSIADDYFSVAIENEDAPGGFDHSGRLILVDPDGQVRAFCDGTDPESVDGFMKDIGRLLEEISHPAQQATK